MRMLGQDLSRRRFLLGSSAATAGALLASRDPSGAGRPLSPGAQSGTAIRAMLAATTPAMITGATVNPKVYHLSNWVEGAHIFDSYVGYPLAKTIQKIYMLEGQFYKEPLPDKITGLASVGCQFIVCVYPSRTTDQSSELTTFLKLLTSKGIVYQVALTNEWNTKNKFPTPQDYLKYWKHYAPVVQAAGVPLCTLVCATSNKPRYAKIEPGFPTDPLPDRYWIDYYGTAYRFKIRLGGLIDQAEGYGVPSGIAEFGWSAGDGSLTMEEWDKYCPYLARHAPRLKLGCLYWGDPGADGQDAVTSADDPKIPGIQHVISAFQSAASARLT
jgi:hypothetical protein